MGKILDSDWSRQNLLRSDWLVLEGATITTEFCIIPAWISHSCQHCSTK